MAKVIMIVDDSSSIRQVVSLTLKSAGYSVIEAASGEAALEQLNGQKIHLIVTDYNMPGMDGLTFVRAARDQEEYRFTPILMLTTEAGGDKKAEGKEAGVKAWLVKPFQPQLLLSAVSKLT